MLKGSFFILLLCISFCGFGFAQSTLFSGDLKIAPYIQVNQTYQFPQSPQGYGKIKEFKPNPKRSPFLFKEERNSAWFLIDIPFDGLFTFEISPHHIKDDYDWMLYPYSPELEKAIQNETAWPLRSNNARNNKALLSKTGLGVEGKNFHEKPGVGNNYSLPIALKAGDKLAMVIDNIYDGGGGFDLTLNLKPTFTENLVLLKGTVKSKTSGKSLPAQILVEEDSTGRILGQIFADATGHYQLKAPSNRPLLITASHPQYLFSTTTLKHLNQDTQLDFELDTLANGQKLILFNIHFSPNKDEILPSAIPELKHLIALLNQHPNWFVKITGHTNNNVFASSRFLQQLSFNRALAVKNYLLKNAIAEKRMSCTGKGGKEPLVITSDPEEGLKNLRVEVVFEKR